MAARVVKSVSAESSAAATAARRGCLSRRGNRWSRNRGEAAGLGGISAGLPAELSSSWSESSLVRSMELRWHLGDSGRRGLRDGMRKAGTRSGVRTRLRRDEPDLMADMMSEDLCENRRFWFWETYSDPATAVLIEVHRRDRPGFIRTESR